VRSQLQTSACPIACSLQLFPINFMPKYRVPAYNCSYFVSGNNVNLRKAEATEETREYFLSILIYLLLYFEKVVMNVRNKDGEDMAQQI
jgi:hypothetical protein